jgi:hypothetical protein
LIDIDAGDIRDENVDDDLAKYEQKDKAKRNQSFAKSLAYSHKHPYGELDEGDSDSDIGTSLDTELKQKSPRFNA